MHIQFFLKSTNSIVISGKVDSKTKKYISYVNDILNIYKTLFFQICETKTNRAKRRQKNVYILEDFSTWP